MKKCVVTCDHCGKQLNCNNGVEDLELPFYIEDHGATTDLCEDCQHELKKLISDFVTKHKEGPNE